MNINPCLKHPDTGMPCDLLHEDKNCDRCMKCDHRVAYIMEETAKPLGIELIRKERGKMETTQQTAYPKMEVRETPVEAQTKACNKCGLPKLLYAFPKNKNCKGGRAGTCNACKAETTKQWYLNRRDKKGGMSRAGVRDNVNIPLKAQAGRVQDSPGLSANYAFAENTISIPPDLFKKLVEIADFEYMTPEKQGIYFIHTAIAAYKINGANP